MTTHKNQHRNPLMLDESRSSARVGAGAGKIQTAIPASYRLLASGLNLVGTVAPDFSGWVLQKMWFTPLHSKPSSKALAFWQSAYRREPVFSGQEWIDLHFWGDPQAPLILGVHGWRGSGVQFRHLVQPLMEAGYQVCLFDMPAHGQYPARFTHVFEFVDTLLEIQKIVGRPAGVVAHSLGCQAVVQALAQGFQPGYLGFVSPGLNIEGMLDSFCSSLGLSARVCASFKTKLAARSIAITQAHVGTSETLFERLSHRFVSQNLDLPGIMIADDRDEEIPWADFSEAADYWMQSEKIFTSGLGHYRILKDEKVLAEMVRYFKDLLR